MRVFPARPKRLLRAGSPYRDNPPSGRKRADKGQKKE